MMYMLQFWHLSGNLVGNEGEQRLTFIMVMKQKQKLEISSWVLSEHKYYLNSRYLKTVLLVYVFLGEYSISAIF